MSKMAATCLALSTLCAVSLFGPAQAMAAARPIRPTGIPIADDLGATVAISGATAVIGAPGVNGTGAAYIFARVNGQWALRATLADPVNGPGDEFGYAVAISGSAVLVGAPSADVLGRAFLYERSGSQWQLRVELAGARRYTNADFGAAVAMDRGTALVSSLGAAVYVYSEANYQWKLSAKIPNPYSSSQSSFGQELSFDGSTIVATAFPASGGTVAFVYARSGTHWSRQAELTDPQQSGTQFNSVAVFGATIMIGTTTSAQIGVVYVFARSDSKWIWQSTLNNPAGNKYGQAVSFGNSLAISGSTAIVGNPVGGPTEGGDAVVFRWSEKAWRPQAEPEDPAPQINDDFGTSVALSGGILVVGAAGANNGDGTAYFYSKSGSSWHRVAALKDEYTASGNFTGGSVAISGPVAAIGALGADHGQGQVYLYARSRNHWYRQATLSYPGPATAYGGAFGTSVAVSGNTVIAGATEIGTAEGGAAYVYVRSGGVWYQQAKLTPPSGVGSFFGWSVSLSGNTAVVDAPGAHYYQGLVFVFVRSGTKWHLQGTLRGPANDTNEGFGDTVATSGNTLAIGFTGAADSMGEVYLYARTGTRWHSQATLTDPRGVPGDAFGSSVALAGDTAVIGANGVRGHAGAAYVFIRSDRTWYPEATLVNPHGVADSGFGFSVAISGDGATESTASETRVLVGSVSVSGLTTQSDQCGRVYEYIKRGSAWRERAWLRDPECRSYDQYGYAVAVSGQTALIGAPGTNNNAGIAYWTPIP